MPKSTGTLIPAQRRSEQPCPSWCSSDHHGEMPGQLSHWGEIATLATPHGPVFADLHLLDGGGPELVLHDVTGNEVRFPSAVAA